jgi:glycerophosphoryl diester phosphodiesterase
MIIISHRGNTHGTDRDSENTQAQFQKALDMGFDVEMDVWGLDGSRLCVGHDRCSSLVDISFLHDNRDRIWVHAKSLSSASKLSSMSGINWFWHEADTMTLTSLGKIWCYPGVYMEEGVTVMTGTDIPAVKVFGICTDYPVHCKSEVLKSNS